MTALLLAISLQAPIEWKTDFDAALAAAKTSGRYLHVHVWAPDDPAGEAMEARTLAKADVAAFSNEGFVNVRIGTKTHEALCRKFGVGEAPATLLLSSDGEKVGLWSGYLGPAEYRKALGGGVKAHGRLKEIGPKLKESPDDPALLVADAECRADLGDALGAGYGLSRAAAKTADAKAKGGLLVRAFEHLNTLPGEAELNANMTRLAEELARLDPELGFQDDVVFVHAMVEINREKWDQALQKLEIVVKSWPKGDRAPSALLTQADLLHHAKEDHKAALAKCKAVMDGWPGTEWAERAKHSFEHIQAHAGQK
jgi:hypothetical protein